MMRSLLGLRKDANRIEAVVTWALTSGRNKIEVDVFKRGKGKSERVSVRFLETGIREAIIKRFKTERIDKENGEVNNWSRGSGTVAYNGNRVELHYVNVRNYTKGTGLVSVPFEGTDPLVNTKEDKRCRLVLRADFNGLALMNVSPEIEIEYGDDVVVPENQITLLQQDMERALLDTFFEFKKLHETMNTKMAGMEDCFVQLQKTDDGWYLSYIHRVIFETTEQGTEVLYG